MIKSENIRILFEMYRKYRWHIVLLTVLGLATAALEGIGINAVIPLLSSFLGGTEAIDGISKIIQAAFVSVGVPFTFRYILGFILALFMIRAVAMVGFSYIRGWISTDFLFEESKDLLRRTLHSSWPFLLKQKMGTLQNTLVRDIQRSATLLELIGQLVQSFGGFLMYVLVALNISPVITLYTLGGGAFLMFFARPLIRKSRSIGEQVARVEKAYAHFLSEHIIGMKSVKAAGVEAAALENGNTELGSQRALSLRLIVVRAISGSIFQPFSLIFVVILFLLTSNTPGFSIITFIATLYLIQKIFTYLESGQNALHGFSEILPYAKNLTGFKKLSDEYKEEKSLGGKPLVFKKEMAFENVSFAYNEDMPTIQDVSFKLAHGTTMGLIGPSGAGKTTMADMLLRLFEPTSGRITLDGEPISNVSMDDWRRYIGYVSQDVFLLNASIAENIRFYTDDLTDADIESAARQANLYDFIMTLPEQFETIVGDRGVLLSGGQRQRVVLARALARKPRLLILDEATSALDSESERLIQESIKALHGAVTVFIIAHRLSTIESVDTLLVLEAGRLTEQGTPAELRANPKSYFAKHHALAKNQ
jgi:ABC-type multidrug transport system fused ATPase/permease subunit